ncbi:hypothetical protein LIER_09114 [Lithospermum erythrorhizon]|uniref:Uncharacterized protein n=1 Tax=Lithospermum erythrorhizon TaxID=34254 RepID=A0AAV3PEL5_LITER
MGEFLFLPGWLLELFSLVLSGYKGADWSTYKVASLDICPRISSMVELRPWDSADRHPFDILRVGVDLEEEVYCATFLACWLHVFVLFVLVYSRWPLSWLMARGVCHIVGSGFVVEPYNPYRFSRHFGYSPTIFGLNSGTREMVDLATGLKFWGACVLSRARQTVTFPGSTSPHSPPVSYKTWLNKLFPSEAPHSTSMKHGKGKHLPTGVRPSTLVFQSSGSSKKKRTSSITVEDRDPKHAKGAWKDTSSSRGSRVASPVRGSLEGITPFVVPNSLVEVSSSISSQEHTELIDTEESLECLAIEVAESSPPALPTLTIAQGAAVILRTRVSSLLSCICTGLEGKSPEMVLKEEESDMKTFEVLTQMGLGNFPDLHDKLQGFFQKAREMGTTSAVTFPGSSSEAFQNLSLLKVNLEDQTSKKQCEVQMIEKLEQESAELETRARDLLVWFESRDLSFPSLISR